MFVHESQQLHLMFSQSITISVKLGLNPAQKVSSRLPLISFEPTSMNDILSLRNVGKVPFKVLFDTSNKTSFGNNPIASGIVPLSKFPFSSIEIRFVNMPMEGGIKPSILFWPRLRTRRAGTLLRRILSDCSDRRDAASAERGSGIGPSKRLDDRSNTFRAVKNCNSVGIEDDSIPKPAA